jgi:hypothetical protein
MYTEEGISLSEDWKDRVDPLAFDEEQVIIII